MQFDENHGQPASFINEAVMEEREFLETAHCDQSVVTPQAKQKQTLLLTKAENDAGEISSLDEDPWLKLSRQVRGALAVKNVVAKPSRRRLGKKHPTNIDPFLQKFSTREIGLGNTLASRGSLRSVEEKVENLVEKDDSTIKEPNDTLDYFTYLRLIITSCFSSTGVIDPDGSFLYYWLYFVITAIRYNFWVIILRFAFQDAQDNFPTLWWILDSLSDFVYLLDIFINCRVGFYEEGILVKDAKLAWKRYIKSIRFYLDVISLIPLEFLYFLTGVLPILRFPRLLKVYKSQEIKNRLEGRASHPTGVRVFFLIHLMFVMIHWNAGIYFLICRAEGFGINDWVYPELNGSYDTLTQKYMRSFYWSMLTLTTIGDLPAPVTNLEYFYTIACYLGGVFVFAMIVGNAGSIILNMDASRLDFERQRDNAKNYMEIHSVPRELQRRVLKWYDYSWSRGRLSGEGGDLNSLHLLPDKMKTEIALHVHLETLKKVTFLQNCEPEFLHELLLKMKLHIFTPGDLIIRHGEIAREMYLITHGRIEVISETGKLLKELGTGDFFGEIGILSLSEGQNRRTADVRSIGYTECFVLSKDDVLGEIQQFPHAQRILAEYGKKRLQNTTSGDPRLVKFDDNDAAEEKETTSRDKSHIVDIETPRQFSEKGNEKKCNGDEKGKKWSKEHVLAISSLIKSRKEISGTTFVETNNAFPAARHEDNDKNINDQRSIGFCEIDTCLNTLDNLKFVLQNALENDVKRQKECMLQLKSQLTVEKEKLLKAYQEIASQKHNISELVRVNKNLKEEIMEKEIRILDMEHGLQKSNQGRSPQNIEPSRKPETNEQTELISLEEERTRTSSSLSTKEMNVGDSSC